MSQTFLPDSKWANLLSSRPFADASASAPLTAFLNKPLRLDGRKLMAAAGVNMGKAVFFDPQYRGILDKMSYGNEGKTRGHSRCALPQMGADVIMEFIKAIEGYLAASGYLFLWVDKFHLMEGIRPWLEPAPALCVVDMITWDKGRIGMGYRSRRTSEHLVVIQKLPRKAKGTWSLHNIPDVWHEKIGPCQGHPHQKPLELQRKLILATTDPGDVILDPAAGSFSVLECCRAEGRNFLGCDLACGEERLNTD